MAKQVGIIRLQRTLGGVNFYKSKNGGDLARRAGGGYASASVQRSDSMTRTRENAREFGLCSGAKKHFRIALAPFLGVRKDGTLHGRMMSMFTQLKKLDPESSRGNRTVGKGMATAEGKDLLRRFDFTPSCKVMQVLGGSATFDFDARSLEVTNFDIRNVSFPAGATHMALTLGLLHFDFDSLKYQLKTSAPLYFDKTYEGNAFTMQVGLPEVAGTQLAVLGMKFYELVGQKYYLFNSAKATGIGNLGAL